MRPGARRHNAAAIARELDATVAIDAVDLEPQPRPPFDALDGVVHVDWMREDGRLALHRLITLRLPGGCALQQAEICGAALDVVLAEYALVRKTGRAHELPDDVELRHGKMDAQAS